MNLDPDDPIDQRVAEINRMYRPPFDIPDFTAIANQWLRGATPALRQNVLVRLIEQDYATRQPTQERRRLLQYVTLLGLRRVEDAPAVLILAEFQYLRRVGQDPDQSDYENYAEFDQFLALYADPPAPPVMPEADAAADASPAPEPAAAGSAVVPRRPPSWARARYVLPAACLLLVIGALVVWGCKKDPPSGGGNGADPPPASLPPILTVRLSDRETLVLKLIDPSAQKDKGTFAMGTTTLGLELLKGKGWFKPIGGKELPKDEDAREVALTRPYYMGVHEVTRGQFAVYATARADEPTDAEKGLAGKKKGSKGFDFGAVPFPETEAFTWRKPGYPPDNLPEQKPLDNSHPVSCVSWHDAERFNRWLSGAAEFKRQVAAQLGSRAWEAVLPTEAQWEFACRAGTPTLFFCGDDQNCLVEYGNISGEEFNRFITLGKVDRALVGRGDGHVFTAPVGSFKPNAFGLHDMHGNVWEWCRDYYGPYDGLPAADPVQLTRQASGHRVLRGGSWRFYITGCRSAYRHEYPPDQSWQDFGFRVCIVVE